MRCGCIFPRAACLGFCIQGCPRRVSSARLRARRLVAGLCVSFVFVRAPCSWAGSVFTGLHCVYARLLSFPTHPPCVGNRPFGTSCKAPPTMVDGVGPFARTCMRSRTHTRVVCPLMRSIALGRCGMKVAKQIIWQSLSYGADGSGWRVVRVMRAQAHGRLQSSALRCARDVRREGAGGLGIVPLEEQRFAAILVPCPWCVILEPDMTIVIVSLRYRASFCFRYRGVCREHVLNNACVQP